MRGQRAILIVLAVVASGCSSPEEATPPPTPTPTVTPTPAITTTPTPDRPPGEEENRTRNATRNGTSSRGWPIEGSFVRYSAEGAWIAPDGSRRTWTNATWRYVDGEWELSCDGTQEIRSARVDKPATSPLSAFDRGDGANDLPPHVAEGMRDADRNATSSLLAWTLHECRVIPAEIRAEEAVTLELTDEGRNVSYLVRRGAMDGSRAWWDERTGILLAWEVQDRDLGWRGRLLSTDAPLARQ